MEIFVSTLNQTMFLFGFIIIGYILSKGNFVPDNSSTVLSKLENMIFIPALVMKTFIDNFTVERIKSASTLLLASLSIAIIAITFAKLISKLLSKDKYTQNIYTYGFSFSNFGFMGNAVVMSLFPDIFFEYLIFTLPLWFLIYSWGAPRLLLADASKKQTPKEIAKSFVNPMLVAMVIGMIIGLLNIKLPSSLVSVISVSGDCMSPVAMLLTGMIVSKISLKKTFTDAKVYLVSAIRLIVMPLIYIFIVRFFDMPQTIFICALCTLAMPLGLNIIVIPSAYGKDTSMSAGMAIVSHIISIITIPLVFMFI